MSSSLQDDRRTGQVSEEQPHKHLFRIANLLKVLVVGVLGGLLTVVIRWDTADALQRRVCKDWDWTREIVQQSDTVCLPKYRVVGDSEAQELIDLLLLRAGQGDPDEAIALFVPATMDSAARDDFIGKWTPVSFSERTAAIRRDADRFNTFEVTWRRFEAPLRDDASSLPDWWAARQTVDDLQFRVTLERTESGDARFAAVTPPRKVGPINATRGLARVTFTRDTHGKRWPDSDQSTGATNVGKGSGERVLCVKQSADQTWWFNTYIGWFSADEVSVEREPAEEWLYCSDVIDYEEVSALDDELP